MVVGGLLSALIWLLFIAAITLGVWLAYRTPPTVRLQRELVRGSVEGQSVPLKVTATIATRLPTRLVLEDTPPRRLVPTRPIVFGGLWQGVHTDVVEASLQPNRRGIYGWDAPRLRWADPLGLFWRTLEVPCHTELEVYPATHGVVLPNLLRPLLSEGQMNRSFGLSDPISLRGARPYVSGDAPAQIHWRLSARTLSLPTSTGAGLPMVRELEKTAASSVSIYLDASSNTTYTESAVRLASSLAAQAWADGLPVSVGDAEGSTPTGRSPESQRLSLRKLAEVQASNLAPALEPPRHGTNLIVITKEAPAELVTQAMRARATAARVAIVVMPEGFYLEPGEKPRKQWAGAPDTVRELERRAGVLAERGVLVFVLRGNQSVLRLA